MAKADHLTIGQEVKVTSGNLDGEDLRGFRAKVVREEEFIPSVDDPGVLNGKHESHVGVRCVLPDGRLSSPVVLPTRRVRRPGIRAGFSRAFASGWDRIFGRRRRLQSDLSGVGVGDVTEVEEASEDL